MKKLEFSQLKLREEIQDALKDMGFVEATHIQQEAIPLIQSGLDIIGQAQTGTGKTAAFGIPLLETINPDDKHTTALVVCPTRELAIQVSQELKKLAKYLKGVHILPIYGGESIQNQIKDLRKGVQVIVGTPGRIMDHMERGTLSFSQVSMVVLDEADEMLNMGFRDDIENILSNVPIARQTVLFSATMPAPILEIAKKHQEDPIHLKVTRENLTNTSIEQGYFECQSSKKAQIINSVLKLHNIKLSLIFCNTKVKVDALVKTLKANGMKADGLHGDLSQAQRNNVLAAFKRSEVTILVATDVAARGLDVNDIEGVFNYDLPMDPEVYVHRIGRTGRAGKTGKAFSFETGREDKKRIKIIEKFSRSEMKLIEVPSEKELFDLNKERFFASIQDAVSEGKTKKFETMLEEMLETGMSVEDVAVGLLKLKFESENTNFKIDPDVLIERDFRRDSDGGGRGGDRDRGRSRGGDRDRGRGGDRDRGSRFGGGDRGGFRGGDRDRDSRDRDSRSSDRGSDRGSDRNSDRGSERSSDRSSERSFPRSSDRGADRGVERSTERSSERSTERSSDRGAEREGFRMRSRSSEGAGAGSARRSEKPKDSENKAEKKKPGKKSYDN